ncbi:MAG: hypothetical protein HFJ91_09915 [Muribaculaceae bacterium]|nr:hypothetical protein [Muribaculaceae bacterium]
MKEIKILSRPVLLLGMMLVAMVMLQSCDPDDDYYYDDPPLVGTWELVSPPTIGYNEFTFYPDGSGTYYVNDYYGEDTYYIEWEAWGGQLTVYFPGQMDTMYFNWSIRGNNLYLYPDDGSGPWIYVGY